MSTLELWLALGACVLLAIAFALIGFSLWRINRDTERALRAYEKVREDLLP